MTAYKGASSFKLRQSPLVEDVVVFERAGTFKLAFCTSCPKLRFDIVLASFQGHEAERKQFGLCQVRTRATQETEDFVDGRSAFFRIDHGRVFLLNWVFPCSVPRTPTLARASREVRLGSR